MTRSRDGMLSTREGARSISAAMILLTCAFLVFSCGKNKPASPLSPGTQASRMVELPPGTFQMGSPPREPGRAANETRHEVTLTRAYSVGNGEVTQDEWQLVMGWNDSFWKGGSLPVEGVTWFDAVDFCNRRSLLEGLTPAYQLLNTHLEGIHLVGDTARVVWNRRADGYRLLTEAEWEYACRAGGDSAFSGGPVREPENSCRLDATLDSLGWFCGNSEVRTHPVRLKSPNAWGLYDMHGNVWEWCWDVADSVYSSAVTDPTGTVPRTNRTNRVVRGGSWGASPIYCRSAYRKPSAPGERQNYIGLRLARTLIP